MTKRIAPFLAVGLAAVIASCGGGSTDPGGPPVALTGLPRQLSSAERQVVDAANGFSFALWDELNGAERGANVFVSPLSASFALGMTLNGAANQTFDEMRSGLRLGASSQHDINEGYRALILLLTTLDPGVKTQIANSIWYRNTFTFNQAFFDTTKAYFGAEVSALDFANAQASLATINSWVSDKTNGKIPTILDQIGSNAVMYLINAIYFKGSWREQFDPRETIDATFHGSAGVAQNARLMQRLGAFSYAESSTWQAADLAYGDSAFTMTIVLPAAGVDIETFAATLNASTWASITGSLASHNVNFLMPRLAMSYERTLNDDLKALGMNVPFIGDVADFTRMSPGGNHLYISNVKQKAFVDINEEGTEAAAATSVEIGVTSAPLVTDMRVDRPYLFVIRERFTGTILFMGKVVQMPVTS